MSGREPIPAPIEDISERDQMLGVDRDHYFSVGASALACINLAMLAARKDASQVRNILDLPCGHGRVLRYMKVAFPHATITACDVDRDGVDYCARTFGAHGIYSDGDEDRISLPFRYDLIWCGSLLTHLDETRSRRFIELFQSVLADDGVLLFTLHGASSAYAVRQGYMNYSLDEAGVGDLLRGYAQSGYGYADYPGGAGYGISLVSPFWVARTLLRHENLRLVTYTEMGWDNHQDVVATVNESLQRRAQRVLNIQIDA